MSESKENNSVSPKEKISVAEAMNEFYKLKSKYESDYHEKYIKPILKANDKSKKEKRIEYQKLPKAECINCKRNVGSIFTIKNQDNVTRVFLAKCGDLRDPCPLNINFDYTFRSELSKELLDADREINEMKNQIIIDKNNIMFGYDDPQKPSFMNFNANISELKTVTESAGFIMEINIQLNDNPVKNDLIKKNEDKFGIEYLLPFKEMIKTFDQTNNAQHVNKAVKFYVDEMVPLTTTNRNLKYEVCYVDFLEKKDNPDPDEKGDLYILIQKKNTLQNLEYTLFGNDELKSFTKGVTGFVSSTSTKTRKNLEQVHRKTRKLRPSIEFEEEGEEPINLRKKLVLVNATEALEALEEPKKVAYKQTAAEIYPELYRRVEGNIIPRRGPNGSITWTNEAGERDMAYQRTWDGLSPEYKSALSEDEDWMKKTMDYFIEYDNLRRQNKIPYMSVKEFVHPDGLLLPPQKIGENKYDYGNAVYNKLLNTDPPGVWLTFLPNPDNPKPKLKDTIVGKMFPDYYANEYNPYLEAIAATLKSKLRFTNSF